MTETTLDAYSRTVIDVAEGMTASVANLQVARRTRRGEATGGGSAVVIAPDGYLLTSAHVVEGSSNGTASFSDGRNTPISLVGSDRLSDLAVLRADAATCGRPSSETRSSCASASSSWRSAIPTGLPAR